MARWERWRPTSDAAIVFSGRGAAARFFKWVRRLPANMLRAATLGVAIISRNIWSRKIRAWHLAPTIRDPKIPAAIVLESRMECLCFVQSRSRSPSRSLTQTVLIAFELPTPRISLPPLTTTKEACTGTGLFGVLMVSIPVQSELTL
jgi:hypothetical protein